MRTVAEIEEAIGQLPEAERIALEDRLISKRFGLDTLSDKEHSELMASLDEAERDIEEGRDYTADELRQAVRSWTHP